LSRDEDEGGTDRARRNRLQWLGRPVPLIGALFLVVLLGLWVQRAPLAENLIERELAARDVHMRYRLASVGLRTQRIENIVLGDPRRPDLTARWVEVDIAIGGLSPVIASVRAGGVRMRGRLHNGKLSLGELDKFMGQGAATTTVLPDIDVALEDARASIATDYGPLGVNLSGSGNLHDAFVGRAVAAMPDARVAQCGARRLVADLRIAMRNGEPRITGPLTAQAIGCPATALALAMPRLDVDFRLDKTLSALNGGASIAASAVRAGGMTLGLPSGQLSAKVDDSGVRGGWTIAGRTLAGRGVIAVQTMVQGALSRDNASHEPGWRVEGRVTVRDMAASAGDPLRGFSAAVSGTPASLLADKLAEAVRLASRDNRLSASFVVRTDVAGGTAELSDLHFASASGARVDLPGGSRAALRWPDGAWSLDGGVTLGGGGGLGSIPVFDDGAYNDERGYHYQWYHFAIRERIRKQNGNADNHVMWRGPVQAEAAWAAFIKWVEAKKRPADLVDGCWMVDAAKKATFVAEPQTFSSKPDSKCNAAYPSSAFTRYVAGGPIDANILKCQLKPIDASDYPALAPAELQRLKTIFPGGVCDYSKPGVNQTPVVPWASFGPAPKNLIFDLRQHQPSN